MSSSKFHSSSPPNSIIDPRNGYCKENGIYYTLNPPLSLPPPSLPLSITSYILSLLPSPPPRHSAIIDSFLSLSYSDILSQVSSLSSVLRTHLQISKGDVVFILASVSANIPILYLALLSIGAVVSPSNTIFSKSEIAHQIDLIKPSIIFTTSSCISDLPTTDLPTFLIDSPLFHSYLRSQYPPILLPLVEVNQDESAVILFSSGTTSQTKGVVLTHRNLIATVSNNSATQTSLQSLESANRVTLFANSIFHVFGFSLLLTSLALGKTAVLIEKVDLETILHAVEIHQVDLLITWPSLLPSLLESNIISNFDLSSLRMIISSGASVRREIAELFAIRFPSVKLFQRYAMTESGGSGFMSEKLGSVGGVPAALEAKIADLITGDALPPGREGELLLRDPTIMKCFIGNSEVTASALNSEGWLKTGDLCYFDKDGCLHIVDRLRELIKCIANQVSPAELEQILKCHPEINDVAVIGYPFGKTEEIPMAFVVKKSESILTKEDIMDFVAKQVDPHKKIKRVVFIDAIPQSQGGKILKRELRNHALKGVFGSK